jgi:GNAT superfamily N-acetyltransferase
MNDESIVISAASDDDYEFSYRVKKAAEGDLIGRTFGWDEAFQREFHNRQWTESRPSIIRLDGSAIGTVALAEGDGCVEIGQFFILPEYQNRGIGSSILLRALQRADEVNIVARLTLLSGNRAEALYRRNGFRPVEQTETLVHMERRPRQTSQPSPPHEVAASLAEGASREWPIQERGNERG